jgi:hypothetical protein
VRFISVFLQKGCVGQQCAQAVEQRVNFLPFEHRGLDHKLRPLGRRQRRIVLDHLLDLLAGRGDIAERSFGLLRIGHESPDAMPFSPFGWCLSNSTLTFPQSQR